MGVKTEHQLAVISCDFCPEELEAYYNQKRTIAEARKLGWSVGKTVKCRKCRLARRKE